MYHSLGDMLVSKKTDKVLATEKEEAAQRQRRSPDAMRQVLDVLREDGLTGQPNKRGTMYTKGQGNWLLAIQQNHLRRGSLGRHRAMAVTTKAPYPTCSTKEVCPCPTQ